MSQGYYNQNNLRAKLIVDGVGDCGFWNRNGQTWDSEATEVDDPEDGNVQIGGKQTGDAVELTRPWKIIRDSPLYRPLKAIRGRRGCDILIFSCDDDGIMDSVPLETLRGVVKSVDLPDGVRNGSTATEAKVVVQVNA